MNAIEINSLTKSYKDFTLSDITMALPMNHIREFAARVKALLQGLTLPDLDTQKG